MKRLALLVLALAFCGAAAAATPEDRLSTVFEAIEANKLDLALKRVDALIADYPNFRLAHLVRGDLLLARARPLLTFGNVVKTVPQERVDGLREEALARLRAARQRPGEDRLPRYVLQLHPEQKHALVVDSRPVGAKVFLDGQFVGATPLALVALALFVAGFGLGFLEVPNMATIMAAFPSGRQGAAGGLSFLARTLGVVAGVALIGQIVAARSATVGFLGAFAESLLVAALAVAAACVVALAGARAPR